MTSDPNEPAVLAVVGTEVEATLIVAALNDAGIEARTSGGLTAGFRAEAPGAAKVLVHQDDLARALETLTAFRAECSEIDWSTVDLGSTEPDA